MTSGPGDRVSGDGGSGGGSPGAAASDPTAAGPGRQAGGLSYAAAGVDIEAGDRAVDLMRSSVASTARPEVMGGIGGFAGLFDAARLAAYRHPVLATSTDGVGTKVVIASRSVSTTPSASTWWPWSPTTWLPAVRSRCS